MYRYTIMGVSDSAFIPRPSGGGRQTPASTTHGVVSVTSQKRTEIPAPRPRSPLCGCSPSQGSVIGSAGTPEFIRPDRYITRAYKRGKRYMGPNVLFSPLPAKPMPVPARKEIPLAELAARRALMGGRIESTPWPKAFQNYFRSP